MPKHSQPTEPTKPLAAAVTALAVTGALVAVVLAGFAAGVSSLRK